jgi:WD40 repeat protein
MDEEAQMTLRVTASENVASAYKDPLRLENEFLARGVDAVIKDAEIAISWGGEKVSQGNDLKRLRQLLDSERHHLRTDLREADNLPQFFFQQLHYRASAMKLEKKAQDFFEASHKRGRAVFRVKAMGRKQNDALIRTFKALVIPSLEPKLFEGSVRKVAMTRDNQRILSANWRELTLWDVDSGRPLRTFKGHTSYIMTLRISDDGKYALSVDNDHNFIFWDLESGNIIRQTSPDFVNACKQDSNFELKDVSLGTDGHFALAAYDNSKALSWNAPKPFQECVIVLWDLEHNQAIRILKYSGWVNAIYLNEDCSCALCGDALDGTIVLWNLHTGEVIRTFSGDTNPEYKVNSISNVILSSDGRYILSSANQVIVLWDMESGRFIRVFRGHSHLVSDICLSPDGRLALSGSADNSMILWNMESGNIIRTFRSHSGSVNAVAFSPDGQFALSGASDGSLILWTLENIQGPYIDEGHFGRVDVVALSRDGRYALTTDGRKLIWWDAAYGRVIQRLEIPLHLAPSSIKIDEQGRFLAGDAEGRVFLSAEPIRDLCMSNDGQQAFLALAIGDIIFLDLKNGREICTLAGHQGPVSSVSLSSSGQYLVSGSYDRAVMLWDVSRSPRKPGKMKAIRTYQGHRAVVTRVAISGDGRYGMSGSEDGTVIRWNLSTGSALDKIEHVIDEVKRRTFPEINRSGEAASAMSLNEDGRRAIIVYVDDAPVVWDFDRRIPLHYLKGHLHVVTAISMSSDSQVALTGSRDDSIILWDVINGAVRNRLLVDGHITSVAMVGNQIIFGDETGQVIFVEIVQQ